jgi:uncharacterized protein with ParB-like and HNH nuclease domain
MKTIGELRTILKFKPEQINSSIKFFAENCKIDFDVYLKSKQINLQRDFVWNIEQKRELIWSILMNRFIPRMAMVNTYDNIYQIIDGKQRLSTMIDFYNNEFDLIIDNENYLYNELPSDYKNVIAGFMFPYYIVNEDYGNILTDEDKIDWFCYINFAGTPQDKQHMESLKQKISTL